MRVRGAIAADWGTMNRDASKSGTPARSLPTADGLLRYWARANPTAPAICDAPNREALGLGPFRAFNYADAETIVEAIAGNLHALGLCPGDVVALQLPNIAETPLLVAGAWRAGLVAWPLPLLWRGVEIGAAFSRVTPRAVICAGPSPIYDNADLMCRIAADHLSIRFILGLGERLPDGVTSIEEVVKETIATV